MKDAGELRNPIGMLVVGDKVISAAARRQGAQVTNALIAERSELETANALDSARTEGAELVRRNPRRLLVKASRKAARGLRNGCAPRLDRGCGPHPVANTKAFKERRRTPTSSCSMSGAAPSPAQLSKSNALIRCVRIHSGARARILGNPAWSQSPTDQGTAYVKRYCRENREKAAATCWC